jgi:outer membrane immunogenic protein
MRRFHCALLATVAVVGFASIAIAADMPLKAPVAAPAAHNWTGCYIGLNVGGASANKDATWTSDDGIFLPSPRHQGSLTASGWAYGGQVGCDYQFSNNWVIGIRGMWDGSSMKGSNLNPTAAAFGAASDQFNNARVRSFGTLTERLGFLVNPAVMLYGLGGIAWAQDHYYVTQASDGGEIFSGDQSRTGYDIGIGLAWMFAQNWDLSVQYDHMEFGTHSVTLVGERGVVGVAGVDEKQKVDTLLFSMDYRFGSY